jgi:hypothetical protein
MSHIDPHVITGNENIRRFLLAGQAILTVRNSETGNRFTFKVCEDRKDGEPTGRHYVKVLGGSNNESDYRYLGTIFGREVYHHGKKSRISRDATSAKAFAWVWNRVMSDRELPECIEVWHEGRCGRCGRRLTVPESIETGIGPVCIGLAA